MYNRKLQVETNSAHPDQNGFKGFVTFWPSRLPVPQQPVLQQQEPDQKSSGSRVQRTGSRTGALL